MSRLRRLKERKIKNRIKATSCGLALALVMGSSQGLGTYALFTDTEDVKSDLAISTGDVDVEISEDIHLKDVEPGKEQSIPVEISNKGTLNQNVKLDIDIPSNITYEYDFGEITIDNNTGVMYKNAELFVLAPGTSIKGNIKITVNSSMRSEIQSELPSVYSVNLTVKSTQISDNTNTVFNDGFYDEVTQTNTVTIAEKEIITIVNGGEAFFTNGGSNEYEKLYIPVNINLPDGYTFGLSATVEAKDKFGNISKGNYSATRVTFAGKEYILIEPEENTGSLLFGGTFNISINVTVNKDNGEAVKYILKCNTTLANAGNNCSNSNHPDHDGSGKDGKCKNTVVYSDHVRLLDIFEDLEASKEEVEVPSEPEIVEPPKEEVEVPSEPEVVEPPKEEAEVPSEPEAVEPPKEEVKVPSKPEVVELPKVEETVVPSQPDVIAPSKEETEIQE